MQILNADLVTSDANLTLGPIKLVRYDDWDTIIQFPDFQEDEAFLRLKFSKSIGNELVLNQNTAILKVVCRTIAILRWFARRLPDTKDIDLTPFLANILGDVGLELPLTTELPLVEWVRESKNWNEHKGTEALIHFIGDLIGSPLEVDYPKDLIMKFDDADVYMDGAMGVSGTLSWLPSKLGRYQDGSFWWPFVYIVRVLQSQRIKNPADLLQLLDAVHPAGMKRVMFYQDNWNTPYNPPDQDILFFADDTSDFWMYKPSYPTFDNGLTFDSPGSQFDFGGGDYRFLNINWVQTSTLKEDSGFLRMSSNTLWNQKDIQGQETLTISGTCIVGDIVGVTLTSSGLAGSPITISYTAGASPTPTTIAAGLAAAVMANATITAAGVLASSVAGVVQLTYPTSLAITFSASTTGSEVVSLSNNPDHSNPWVSFSRFVDQKSITAVVGETHTYLTGQTTMQLANSQVNQISSLVNTTQSVTYYAGFDYTYDYTGLITWVSIPANNDVITTSYSYYPSKWTQLFADNDSLVMENVTTNVGISGYTVPVLNSLTFREMQYAAFNLDQANMRGSWLQEIVYMDKLEHVLAGGHISAAAAATSTVLRVGPFTSPYILVASANWNTDVYVVEDSLTQSTLTFSNPAPGDGSGRFDYHAEVLAANPAALLQSLTLGDTTAIVGIPTATSKVIVTPNWITSVYYTAYSPTQATLAFSNPAPTGGKLNCFFVDTPNSGQVSVTAGQTSKSISISMSEPFQVFAMPNWNTGVQVTRTTTTISLTFSVPAPAGAFVVWATHQN